MGTVSRKIRKMKYALGEALECLRPGREEKAAPEEGLEYEMGLIDLAGRAVAHGDTTCVPEEVKVYTDRVWLKLYCGRGEEMGTEEVTCLRDAERWVAFRAAGQEFRWDIQDRALRFTPEFDPAVRAELNPWVAILDSRVVRVEREYALHNLSAACLEYAFGDNGDSFDWCIADNSTAPLVFELAPVFAAVYEVLSGTYLSVHVQDNMTLMVAYTCGYCEGAGLTVDNFIERNIEQQKRELWEPETV